MKYKDKKKEPLKWEKHQWILGLQTTWYSKNQESEEKEQKKNLKK